MRLQKILLFIIVILIGFSTVAYGLYKEYSYATPSDKLNSELSNNADKINFVPFYFKPAVLYIGGPEGFRYKENSLSVSPELISFELTDESNKTIAITQQKKPDNFYAEDFPGRIQLNVVTGRAVIGQNQNVTTASIFGDKSMLFLRSTSLIDDDTVRAILSAFTYTL